MSATRRTPWRWAALAVLLAMVGCTKYWTEEQTYGAIHVRKDWSMNRLDWERNSTGVYRYTFTVGGKSYSRSYASVYEQRAILVIESTDLTLLLDEKTGAPATCEQCDCPLVQTPLGPALEGGLVSDFAADSSLAHFIYPPEGASEVCFVRFIGDSSYRAFKRPWPSKLVLVALDYGLASDPVAIGCGQTLADGNRDCQLLILRAQGPETLSSDRRPAMTLLRMQPGDPLSIAQ